MISFLLRLLALLTIASHAGFAAPYHRPNESKELFQLENIPLQVHTMRKISKHLVVLASRKQNNSAEARRASAQLLALAMRLDPTNPTIRETDKSFAKGSPPPQADNNQVAKAMNRVQFYKRWLASPNAGENANILASLITDATKTLDPQTRNQPDTADWSGVLPAIQGLTQARPPKPEPNLPSQPQKPSSNNVTQSVVPQAQFHLTKLLIHAPLTIERRKNWAPPSSPKAASDRYTHKKLLARIEMEIAQSSNTNNTLTNTKTAKNTNPLTVKFFPSLEKENSTNAAKPNPLGVTLQSTVYQKISYTLNTLLHSRHSKIPASEIKIKLSHGRYALSNYLAITAPLAIMLEASATNQPLRKDLYICAAINAQGELRQPQYFWEQFQLLRNSGQRGRLIVAAESYDLMIQSLAFGDPDFFTHWEVFSAETFDEAMELAPQKNPKNIADASALFRTIQQLTQKSQVTQIAVNQAVRSRLSEIVGLAPNHLSAKALLVQGSVKRPAHLNSLALAHVMFPIITHIEQRLPSRTATSVPSSNQLKMIHTELRESIDPLAPLVDRTDDELYQQTLTLINEFRRLEILLRRSKHISEEGIITISQSANDLIRSMADTCKSLREQVEKTINAP